jgi:DNA-binding MarR family transcriptional regulator
VSVALAADTEAPEASLIYIVGRLHQGIRREMRRRLAPWKLSVQEYTALAVLGARPGLSNAQLARRALVTPQSMIEILAKLERRELVARHEDPAHRRILRAQLTAQGRKLLSAADPAIAAIQDEMLVGVPAHERQAAARVMHSAMTRLSQPGPVAKLTR